MLPDKMNPTEILSRPTTRELLDWLRAKYKKSGKKLIYPIMSFNYIAIGDGGGINSGAYMPEDANDILGMRFTLRHGVLDTFHVHDAFNSDHADVQAAMSGFLQTMYTGDPVICAESQRSIVAKVVYHFRDTSVRDFSFAEIESMIFTIRELEICLFNLAVHQYDRHYNEFHEENKIYDEWSAMIQKNSKNIPVCCRFTAPNIIFDLYRMCRMANFSSNIYLGNMLTPGSQMFGLVYPHPEQDMATEALEGNRLWQLSPQAAVSKHRENFDPVLIEGPHAHIQAKKEQGYVMPGGNQPQP
ncbi:hypothetical protein L596_012134 [Steinernema carpocapsae]|uniref:Maelstrom domain-containing protein n=1 Tax=Steinernema carpocapsae TaxID=34508 RepID=A0A4U5NW28_STECR|nr:hypothetical protein L596_012134 [Steinernema carpocapsae]